MIKRARNPFQHMPLLPSLALHRAFALLPLIRTHEIRVLEGALAHTRTGAKTLLAGLNEAQQKAVQHHTGPLVVVAGAGSGKTKTLTHRIAHLIKHNNVAPERILAVTFTNKAAQEMKKRLHLLLDPQAEQPGPTTNTATSAVTENVEEKEILADGSQVSKQLWVGTFHALFSRILRYDIEKFTDKEGLTGWTKNFSIYDESDVQSILKNVINELELSTNTGGLDPKLVRKEISKAKNRGLMPREISSKAKKGKEAMVAEVYKRYRAAMAANNALDFDDLLLFPTLLLEQNEQTRNYWHNRFQHVLVDEYQDTNPIQFKLIRLLTTNGLDPVEVNWKDRSVFVVGDDDQSIYGFRAVQPKTLMHFQETFGDRRAQEFTQTMVKLEHNYRSTATILKAANALIENNTGRLDKVLRPTLGKGGKIILTECGDERQEAVAVKCGLQMLQTKGLKWGAMAVLYRTNAQSRLIEQQLVRNNIPFTIVKGLRFFDRREIKDVVAYLRFLVNKTDSVSLMRVINNPTRGLGPISLKRLSDAADQQGVPMWEIINSEEAVRAAAVKGAVALKGLKEFRNIMADLQQRWEKDKAPPSEIIQEVLTRTGYLKTKLFADNTDGLADDRKRNVLELVNAAIQFQEENKGSESLEDFLSSAALASGADGNVSDMDRVSLMTVHSSKGLEFPVVWLVGLEQGLLPMSRPQEDQDEEDAQAKLEEERRLCYVGFTRAKDLLFLSFAWQRKFSRGDSGPSEFLQELPKDLLEYKYV